MKKERDSLLLKDILESTNIVDCNNPELEIAMENIMDGNCGDSPSYHLDNICKEAFLKLPTLDEERSLFRFTGFPPQEIEKWDANKEGTIGDIINNRITLSNPKNFNDPMDPIIKAWCERRKIHSTNNFDKKLYQLIDYTLGRIRICCLVDPLRSGKQKSTIENCSPLMWAYYAKNHTGICIRYKIKPSNLISQENEIVRLLDVNYNITFPLDGNIPFTDSIVVKGNCWNYENEVRLVLYSSNDNIKDYHSLEGYEISAIYMGCRIDAKKRAYLIELLKDRDIELYQMAFSKKDITKLECHKVQK